MFREGHDKLGAEVVLTGPDGVRRDPVRMTKHGDVPDRYDAWVTPDAAGRLDLRDPGLVGPGRHLAARGRAQDPGRRRRRPDVHRGPAAARARAVHRATPRPPTRACSRARSRRPATSAARPRPGWPCSQDPGLVDVLHREPAARAHHRRGSLPGVRRPPARAVRQLVRVLPALRGRHRGQEGQGHQRQLPDRGQAPRRRGRDGLRRHLPAADPPDRRGQPQGPQQHPRPRPRRHRVTVGDRVEGRRPRRDPPRPRHARGLRRVRRARQRPRPRGRARPRAAGRARPPVGDEPPAVLHHPGRRDHRLRREPAEEVPGHLPDELRQRPGRDLSRGAAGRQALDGARRPGLPGRQPAHQAGRVLGVAAQGDPAHRPRRDLPVRGVHPAADDARPGRRRLPPVLHVLHLAHRQVGARGLPPRGVPRVRPH